MINTQYINLNMTPSGVLPVLHCSQYDIGRQLGVVVYNGSEAVDISQYTATIEATRTDGTAITAAVTSDGNVGTFDTTATMTNVADKYDAQLILVDGDSNRVASLPFIMCIVPAAMDENSEAIEEDAPLYQQYNAALQSMVVAERTARTAADATLQSNINAETSTRTARDNVLQAEIDQLVAPSGDAPSAAEVENARVGADGVIYNTLGNAIRTQVTDLETSIDDISEGIDYATVTADASITSNGITLVRVSDNKVKLYGTATASRFLCFLNGQNGPVTSSGTFGKTLDAGTYLITLNMTGTTPLGSLRFTYSQFSDTFLTVTANTKARAILENPTMVGFATQNGRDYGTEESPTYIEAFIQQATAVDTTARADIDSIEDKFVVDRTETIDASTDIDDIMQPGIYRWSSSANAPLNSPTSVSASMIVLAKDGVTGTLAQLIIGSSGVIFARARSSNAWHEWREFYNTDRALSDGGILDSSNNINNVTDTGYYNVYGDSLPTNLPAQADGMLVVIRPNFSITREYPLTQIYFTTSQIYYRKGTSNGYTQWVAIIQAGTSTLIINSGDNDFYNIPLEQTEDFEYYINQGGSVEPVEGSRFGTDYIPCPPYLLVNFAPDDSDSYIIINFYTKTGDDYTPRWDVLDVETDGIKNKIGLSASHNRTIAIPSGTYMKVSVSGSCELFGWIGKHLGGNIAGLSVSPSDGESFSLSASINTGYTGIRVPGDSQILFAKGAMLCNIWGANGSNRTLISTGVLLQSIILPTGYDYFYARVVMDADVPYNSTEPVTSNYLATNDLDGYISTLSKNYAEKSYGRSDNVIKRAKQICDIKWVCQASGLPVSNSSLTFKKDLVYQGVPYMSEWRRPCYLGWHISRHTFVNAANDADSVFYKEFGRNGGPGYGLVCSSFATLVCGWPYPTVNDCFPIDPKCHEIKVNKPLLGMVLTNNDTHCFIPESFAYGNDYKEYSLFEESSPMTRRITNYDFITDDATGARNWRYLNGYVYSVEHDDAIDNFPGYDMDDNTIVNGSARPYKGDRSVYTSEETIRINIKDSSAVTCYYQKCLYNNGTLTPTGTALGAAVQHEGTYYYANIDHQTLADGFYAVWTDVNNTKEYFEYVTMPVCTYSRSNGNFTFTVNGVQGGSFWYVCWWEDDTVSGNTEIIPFVQSGDYSAYFENMNPNNSTGYMFFKGTFGAYVATVTTA